MTQNPTAVPTYIAAVNSHSGSNSARSCLVDESFHARQRVAAQHGVREGLGHPESKNHRRDERIQEDRAEDRARSRLRPAEADRNRRSGQSAACRHENEKDDESLRREKDADVENAASHLRPLQRVPGAHEAHKRLSGHTAAPFISVSLPLLPSLLPFRANPAPLRLVERIVANFVVGAHVDNSLPRGFQGSPMEFAMCGLRGIAAVTVRLSMCQVCGELLPDGVRNRRLVVRKTRESRTQGALTRDPHFAADRIIVMQVERA